MKYLLILALALLIGMAGAVDIHWSQINLSESLPSNENITFVNGSINNHIFFYTGTTEDGLESFITANGEGTYYLTEEIVVDDELTISTDYVKLCGASYMWSGRTSSGPYFNVTMTSGTAINLSTGYVTLDHPNIIFSNTASTATAIRIAGNWIEVISPTIFASKGTAISFENSPFYWKIQDANIELDQTTGTGTAFSFGDTGSNAAYHGIIEGGMITGGAYGINAVEGCPIVYGAYFLNQSADGIYFAPNAEHSTGDAILSQCIFDFQSGAGIKSSGAYEVANVDIHQCWIYTDNTNECIYPQNAANWMISDCAMLKSQAGHAIYIGTNVDGLTISDNKIETVADNKCGILTANAATIGNLVITGNRISTDSGDYGIAIEGDPTSWTLIGNQATIYHPTTGALKIEEHNRDT